MSRLDWVGCDHELRLGEAVHDGKDSSLLAVPELQRLTCQCQQRSARLIHLERIHLAGEDLVFHVLLVRLGINQGDLLVALRAEEFSPPRRQQHAPGSASHGDVPQHLAIPGVDNGHVIRLGVQRIDEVAVGARGQIEIGRWRPVDQACTVLPLGPVE